MIREFSRILAKYRAKTTYPEDIALDLNELLATPRQIAVTIIDDEPFPWADALEMRGCKVTYYRDYTKPITQANQKIKTYDFRSQDIIICDIHGVGSVIYPGHDGIGVMEDLRRKNPLHVIAAYTGNPGAIYSKLRKQDTLDMVFSRDWAVEDFLFNFDELAKIFTSPKRRWEFIRKRLTHLDVNEQKISEVREMFVENVLLGQILKQKFRCSAGDTKKIITATSESFDVVALAKFGLGAKDIISLVSPFVLESLN